MALGSADEESPAARAGLSLLPYPAAGAGYATGSTSGAAKLFPNYTRGAGGGLNYYLIQPGCLGRRTKSITRLPHCGQTRRVTDSGTGRCDTIALDLLTGVISASSGGFT